MRVCVQLGDLAKTVRAEVTSHIRANWTGVTIESGKGQDRGNGNARASLVIGKKPVSNAAWPRQESIVAENTPLEELLFLIDVKLAKLTNSNMNAEENASIRSSMSRRDFLFGAFHLSSQPSDAPVVSRDSCEARFGCHKCVEACPVEGALKIEERSVVVSNELCIRCGLCAGICPVAAIQVPAFSENAYKALLAAIQKSSAPKKTLVVTCDEQSVRRRPWMDVEQVPGIAVMGICQLAMAAASSISETIVYCPDGLCAGKENAKKAAGLIASLVNEPTPVVSYVEGKDGAARVDQIHESARPRSLKLTQATSPWKDYVNCLASISVNELAATGFGFTEMHVADSCTLCNGCVESCPHHAIAIQQNTLNFQPEECTGCGYCAEICPEHSITLSQMKGPTTLQNRIVYTGEMVNCLKCGSPYASARMVEKVSTILHDDSATKLCPDCRQREIYEKIFARSQSAV